MTESPLLRTGEFARAASVSVKALRLHHEMGLLVPKVVDPTTGYRAYSPSQLTNAAISRLQARSSVIGRRPRRGDGALSAATVARRRSGDPAFRPTGSAD